MTNTTEPTFTAERLHALTNLKTIRLAVELVEREYAQRSPARPPLSNLTELLSPPDGTSC